MRALFYDPYLDSMGGGERYTLTLVQALAAAGWQTALLWDHKPIHKKAKSKFNLDLGSAIYLPTYHFTTSIPHRISFMQKFDLAFVVSDGSIPLLAAKHNILHFQVPFHDVAGNTFANRLKKHSIQDFVANSHFTKDIVDDEYGITCKVIYPPISIKEFKPQRKQNLILYLARFSNLLQHKGHEDVIEAFKELYETGIKNYRLWIAGSTEIGTNDLIKRLHKQAKGYPIEITTDPPFEDIKELYGKAKYFWATAGLDASEANEPEKCEHFGITTVEAMAAGCVPLAIRKGGFREIIQHNENGILFTDLSDLVTQTKILMKDHARHDLLAKSARTRAQYFSQAQFTSQFFQLLNIESISKLS